MKRIALSTAALALMAGTAYAQVEATALTDLNLRAGPGPQYEVQGLIAVEDKVAVEGCVVDGDWCKVDYMGQTGWAYNAYLDFGPDANTEVATIVIDNNSADNALAGSAVGAAVGAAIGGPLTIAAGILAGGMIGTDAAPAPEVIAYVNDHPVDTVILDGEVVVGAGIPEGVEIHEVPDSEYAYLSVNGQPVIVEPGERKIVTIVR